MFLLFMAFSGLIASSVLTYYLAGNFRSNHQATYQNKQGKDISGFPYVYEEYEFEADDETEDFGRILLPYLAPVPPSSIAFLCVPGFKLHKHFYHFIGANRHLEIYQVKEEYRI